MQFQQIFFVAGILWISLNTVFSVKLDLRDEVRTKFEIRNHIPGRLKIERSYRSPIGRRPLDSTAHIPAVKLRGHYFPVPGYVQTQGYLHTPPPRISSQYKDPEPIKGLRYYRGRGDRYYRMQRSDAEEIYRSYRVLRKRYIPMTRPSVRASGDVLWPVDWPSPVLER